MTRSSLSLAACALAAAGCGDGGPRRYDISGGVTCAGRPLVEGTVTFEPDPALKNTGPQGFAEIKDGRFSTARGGRGTVGGPMRVKISGRTDSRDGTPVGIDHVHEYRTTADLPRATATADFDVPKSASHPGSLTPVEAP